jgi:hypothetical protein
MLVASTSALCEGRDWCGGDAFAPGCLALDSIRAANVAGDFRLNCLSVYYCATASADSRACPASGTFGNAVRRLRQNAGADALSALEGVCWQSIETSWEQREEVARLTRLQLVSSPALLHPDSPDREAFTESRYTAWTMDRAERAMPRDRYSVRLENDSFGQDGTDSDYTMGFSLSGAREGRPTDGWVQRPMLAGLEWLNRLLSIDPDGVDASATTWWRFGSADYTPRRIKVEEPQQDDIPYASLVYFTSGYSENHGPTSFDSSFEIGVLGTNVGREVQTAIHKVCCQKNIPRGWDHQVGDGGSLTFLYHAQWNRAVAGDTFGSGWVYQLRPLAGAEFGYYTRAQAGVALYLAGSPYDLGRVRGGFLPGGEPGTPADLIGPPADRGTGLSLWLEYEMSAFAHNELLQGAWSGRNDVTHSYNEIEPYVWRTSIGVELTAIERLINPWHPKGGRFYVTQQMRSRQLVDGPPDPHTWGGFYYSWGM